MKIPTFLITLTLMTLTLNLSFAQGQMASSNSEARSYAYISVQGKLFSKKLRVQVDLGDDPEQIEVGNEISELLTNKKSYAAILNYMVENGFELVETLTLTATYQGSGGTEGVIFVMKNANKKTVAH